MHFLLIPYALLSAMFVMHFHQHDRCIGNTGLTVVADSTAALFFLAMLFRPVTGDSWRYYQYFLSLRDAALGEVLQDDRVEVMFKLLNWRAGQPVDCQLCFFGATLLLFMGASSGPYGASCRHPIFTDEMLFQTMLQCSPGSLTRWRQRLGEARMEQLLAQTIAAARSVKAVDGWELSRMPDVPNRRRVTQVADFSSAASAKRLQEVYAGA